MLETIDGRTDTEVPAGSPGTNEDDDAGASCLVGPIERTETPGAGTRTWIAVAGGRIVACRRTSAPAGRPGLDRSAHNHRAWWRNAHTTISVIDDGKVVEHAHLIKAPPGLRMLQPEERKEGRKVCVHDG